MPILNDDAIFVAGHRGMVGSAICRELTSAGFTNIVAADRVHLDLTDTNQTGAFLATHRPKSIVIAAAKVGGINANNKLPVDFLLDNLMIECNLISGAHAIDVDRLIFLGSSCIYPKLANQPITERELLRGQLEPTNEPYAIAKIAGIKLCESYNRQYGTDYRSLMPTNLYGPNDNFDLESSHVIPALIRKFHEAKVRNDPAVEIWGSGKARREFLHVNDLAKATLHFLQLEEQAIAKATSDQMSHINIGTGVDLSIAELAALIADIVEFEGELKFNADMPDGTPVKRLDVSLAKSLGWKAAIDLRDGLRDTYHWYAEQHNASNRHAR